MRTNAALVPHLQRVAVLRREPYLVQDGVVVLRAVRVVPVRPVVAGAADVADQLPRVEHLPQRALGSGVIW